MRHVKLAVRMLLKTPLVTAVAVVSLALGTGSTQCSHAGDCEQVFSYPMFRDLQRAQTVFTGIAAHKTLGANLAVRNEPMVGQGVLVSG